MSSNRELFGDDSSDDEEEELKAISEAPGTAEQKEEPPAEDVTAAVHKTAKEDGAKDDEEKDDDPSNNKKPNVFADSDDDEPEFDDQGAVVGHNDSTTIAASSKTQQPAASSTQQTEEEEEEEAPVLAKTDTRTLVIQEIERPDESIKLHITKLPNLVGVQTEAFDPDSYLSNQEEEDFGQSAFNLMRWRYKEKLNGDLVRDDKDNLVRESNTRLVEWEDGTFTLHIGDEVFHMDSIKSPTDSAFPGFNGYLYLSQTASYKDDNETQPAGTVLECMGPMRSRFTVRPSSLQSEAHKSLTVGIRQKTIKTAKIAQFVTQEDPEKLKQERIKVKSDLEKAAIRKRSSSQYQQPRRPRMSRAYLEEHEDDRNYDTFNIKDMKRRTMGGDDFDENDESSEESDDDLSNFRSGDKRKKAADQKVQDDDDEMELDDEDDEEEDAPVMNKKKRSHQAVLDDDDSD